MIVSKYVVCRSQAIFVEKEEGTTCVGKFGIKKEQPTLLFLVLVWVYD